MGGQVLVVSLESLLVPEMIMISLKTTTTARRIS